jgi:uncharacterized protein YqgC (DUF456 family)
LSPLEIGGVSLFILVLLIGAYSILFGFPGTVIILLDTVIYAAFTGFESISVRILLTLLILSALAEIADFAMGMAGAVKLGATRSGFFAFLIGGPIGALVMTPFLLGLGLIAGIFWGGFTAMLMMHLIDRSRMKPNLRATYGEVFGRAAGVCVKGTFALIMVIISLTSLYS